MKPTKPRLAGRHAIAAKNQPQYEPIDIVFAHDPKYKEGLDDHNTVVMAFEPTPEDRQRIINGEMIYVALLTFGGGQQPILVSAGPQEFSERYNIPIAQRIAVPLKVEHVGDSPTDLENPNSGDPVELAAEGPSGLTGRVRVYVNGVERLVPTLLAYIDIVVLAGQTGYPTITVHDPSDEDAPGVVGRKGIVRVKAGMCFESYHTHNA